MKKRLWGIIAVLLLVGTAGTTFAASEEGAALNKPSREDVVLSYQDMPSWDVSFAGVKDDIPCVQGTLPGSYSSSADVNWEFEVQKDYVTPVKSQNPYGTCWAHTAISVAETSYIINYVDTFVSVNTDNIDFNEYHLVHYLYTTPNDPLGLFGGDYNYIPSGDLLDRGGNSELALYGFANWIGVSDSTDFTSENVGGENADAFGFEDAAHLQNGYVIAMPDMTATTYQADMDIVKQMIMEYGSVAASYYSASAGGEELYDGYYYYPTEIGKTNHAVTIVGWDDSIPASSFTTAPAGDGAWLVKNSWGSYGPFGGYFWMSYYDKSLADTVCVYDFVSADNYDNNYQYDGTVCGSYTGYTDQSVYANAFVADSDETLEAIGFYTLDINTEYELRIYKNLAAGAKPGTGDLVYTSEGTETYAGFHTVDLPEAIEIAAGERYAIVITVYKEGDYAYIPVDRTYTGNWIEYYSYAKAGESYFGYSINSLYDMNEDNTTYADGVNVRIKAFTNEVEQTMVDSGVCGDDLTWTLDSAGTLTISGSGAMYDYTTDDRAPWYEHIVEIKRLVLSSNITTIGDYAFINCSGITGELIIPEGVTTIGTMSFNNCIGLSGNLEIPAGAVIEDHAFFGCTGFDGELILAEGITTIGEYAFYDCSGLNGHLNLPSTLTSIGCAAFLRCDGFTGDLVIPEGVTLIDENVFYGCSGFDGKLVIPEGVTMIYIEAFYGCSGLTGDLVIPESVELIEWDAFGECESLNSISLMNKACEIGDSEETFPVDVTIKGYENSTAQVYSETYDRTFEAFVVLNGVYQSSDGNWYYYEDGVVDTTYTGLSTNDYGTWYVVKGQVDFSKSGVLQIGGQWCYLKQGKLQTDYTGFGTNAYGTWYIENGQIDFATTGTVTVSGNEYLVIGSKLRDDFTGFTDETYNRVYVAKGRVYRNLNGVLQLSGVWAYVINGEWQADYTGFATNDYGTWYINQGKVDFSGNGLVEVNGDTCYMVSGKLQSSYVGFVSNAEGSWYVSQGKVDYTKTDVFKVGTDWYYVIEGKWQSDFTGIADNAYGSWYIENGYVDFTYSGTYTEGELTYTIKEGKVVSIQ